MPGLPLVIGGDTVLDIIVLVLLAALAWVVCVALGLPGVLATVAFLVVLIGGLVSGFRVGNLRRR
jgi:NADH:ubiquinone oxidoreductase subunit 3 (subunit A)